MSRDWDNWNIWDGSFHSKINKFYNISLCTTVMDRLFTLEKCLVQNIEDNKHYPNIEFLVLDYNSKDNLKDWMLTNMLEHLESGLVTYYRTETPQYYSMTHSRNLAFKLAGIHKRWELDSHIVNNVDADNYVQKDFASWLNALANEKHDYKVFAKGKRGINGRLGFIKSQFISLGGYNEEFANTYGYDDHDLMVRALLSDYKLMWFGGRFQERITTPRGLVGKNMENSNWRETEKRNKVISAKNITEGKLVSNVMVPWGNDIVTDYKGNEIIIK